MESVSKALESFALPVTVIPFFKLVQKLSKGKSSLPSNEKTRGSLTDAWSTVNPTEDSKEEYVLYDDKIIPCTQHHDSPGKTNKKRATTMIA